MWKRMTVALLLVLLCGCIKDKDDLTINADGSGTVHIETQTSIPPELSDTMGTQLGMGRSAGILVYPPLTDAEARKFFPGQAFHVTVQQRKADNGNVITVIEADFKDINALLASPYGRAHQLSVKIDNGSLVVRGVTGMEAVARFAAMKDDTGLGMAAVPGLADLQTKKNEMRAEFGVTLPNAIASGNGALQGKTMTWIVERDKCKDDDDFARQLGSVSEASCPASGLTLSPVTPLRMGLAPFAKLAPGATEAEAAVNTNRIVAAARFVPYGLSVKRSLDLSGAGGGQENGAQFIGAVVIPRELAPQKWGIPQLDEVVDAKGNDLKLANADSYQRYSSYSMMEPGDDESATNNVERHIVVLNFRPPDWKVNEIARIKGSVGLQYFGGSQLVKLTNAIPASWIADASKMLAGGSFDSADKALNSPGLTALGLELTLQMGIAQNGMTMLNLQIKGNKTALTDAQVFDVRGTPWPTFLQQQDFGGADISSCQILVAGKPEPPLSLALMVGGGGPTVQVPILAEHVPVAN